MSEAEMKRDIERRGLNWTIGYWGDVWPEPRWRAWIHTRDLEVPDSFGESTESEFAAIRVAYALEQAMVENQGGSAQPT